MSNNSLLDMRNGLRQLLNDSNKKMWSDNELNGWLKVSHEIYYNKFVFKNRKFKLDMLNITFPAGATPYDLSGASVLPVIGVMSVVDNTNASAPQILIRASADEYYRISAQYPNGGVPTHYRFARGETIAAGVVTMTQVICLAPAPTSDRSLMMEYQVGAEATQFSSDTHTTGLPHEVEVCISIQAQIYARLKEENHAAIQILRSELELAERNMLKYATQIAGPDDEVVFDPAWIS